MERDGDPLGTAQGRAVLAQARPGELAERPDALMPLPIDSDVHPSR